MADMKNELMKAAVLGGVAAIVDYMGVDSMVVNAASGVVPASWGVAAMVFVSVVSADLIIHYVLKDYVPY